MYFSFIKSGKSILSSLYTIHYSEFLTIIKYFILFNMHFETLKFVNQKLKKNSGNFGCLVFIDFLIPVTTKFFSVNLAIMYS